MRLDEGRRFLSLMRVLAALVLGGAAGFLVVVWDYDPTGDPMGRSKAFLEGEEGLAWLAATMAQFAVWALLLVLRGKRLWQLLTEGLAVRPWHGIASLLIYLVGYFVLLWFPQQLTFTLGGDNLQDVPLPHFQLKTSILSSVQFVVVLILVAQIWLADRRIRHLVISDGGEEEHFSALLEARRQMLNLGAIFTTLAAMSFLGLVLYGRALAPYVSFQWLSRPPLLIYGAYLTVLVAVPYVPAYLNVLAFGRAVRDHFYPRLSPSAPGYDARRTQRRRVDDLLGLQWQAKESVRIVVTVLVPVATSLVYTFLGLK